VERAGVRRQAGPKEVAIDIASQTRYTIHNR
jgi:hypothetical protein